MDALVAVLVLTLALLLVARIAFAGNSGLDASERALGERATAREAALEELRDLLDKAEASGVSERSFDEIWDDAAANARAQRHG